MRAMALLASRSLLSDMAGQRKPSASGGRGAEATERGGHGHVTGAWLLNKGRATGGGGRSHVPQTVVCAAPLSLSLASPVDAALALVVPPDELRPPPPRAAPLQLPRARPRPSHHSPPHQQTCVSQPPPRSLSPSVLNPGPGRPSHLQLLQACPREQPRHKEPLPHPHSPGSPLPPQGQRRETPPSRLLARPGREREATRFQAKTIQGLPRPPSEGARHKKPLPRPLRVLLRPSPSPRSPKGQAPSSPSFRHPCSVSRPRCPCHLPEDARASWPRRTTTSPT